MPAIRAERHDSCWMAGLTACCISLIPAAFTTAAGNDDPADPLQSATADLLVNAENDTYDSKPSLAAAPDGSLWMAWHAYRMSRDRLLVRRLGPGEPGPIRVASGKGDVHDAPVIVPDGNGSIWVFWAAREASRWQILGRKSQGDRWQPIVTLSDQATDAVMPAAIRLDDGRVVLSWCAHGNGRFQVWSRILEGDTWRQAAAVSASNCDAFRSALAADGDRVWIFWDVYQNGRYSVWTKPLSPQPGMPERISPEGENCLLPVPLAAKSGLYVAWLNMVDVIGGEGAISQYHTLQVAFRDRQGWQLIGQSDGDSTAAELTHGLMARIEPTPVATGGYMGRRRHPMLLEDGDDVWLLWERKSDHRGRTPNAPGELIGRRLIAGRWDQPVVLHQGLVDYHLAHESKASGGKFVFVASQLPRNSRRVYHRLIGDLNASAEFQQDDWPGWKPVELPFADQRKPRQEIRQGDTIYRLYWSDLHCHSGLTADAEGQPDELLHYARDKARLDVVVMTQNDCIYDSYLTEAEFALDHFLANAYTREGRFLVLPGYEWTSRVPRSPDVALSDPRNWDSQNWGNSQANHRTVVYPPFGGPVMRHPEIGNDVHTLNQAAFAAGGLTLTQHPTWHLTGQPAEVGVEVTAGWGIYIQDPTRVYQALDDGFRFGLVGNGDSHRRNPGLCGGLTAIYAEELTAGAILDALRNRRVYATNGSRIVIDSRANGTIMGNDVPADDCNVQITLSVTGTKPIVKATLIRDGKEVKVIDGNGTTQLSAVFREEQLSPGTHWYYWRIAQQGTSPRYPGNVKVARGHLAWSTPHWVIVQ